MSVEFRITIDKKRMFIGWNRWDSKIVSLEDGDFESARKIACEMAEKQGCLPREKKWVELSRTHILSDGGPLRDDEGNACENHRIEVTRLNKNEGTESRKYRLELYDSVRCRMEWRSHPDNVVGEALNTLRAMYNIPDAQLDDFEKEGSVRKFTIKVNETELVYTLFEI